MVSAHAGLLNLVNLFGSILFADWKDLLLLVDGPQSAAKGGLLLYESRSDLLESEGGG